MGLTLAEKILARHARKDAVAPGDMVEVVPDLVMANDVSGPLAVRELEQIGADRVFDPDRVVFVLDHFTPNKDIRSAEACQAVRDFAKKCGISRVFDAGWGIEHVLLPELGLVAPGHLVIGADSHTTTYGALGAFATGVGSTDAAAAMVLGRIWLRVPATIRFQYRGSLPRWVGGKDLILMTLGAIGVSGARYAVMEFGGEVIRALGMDDRFTMCNMAVEAGAKAGMIEPDDTTMDYLRAIGAPQGHPEKSDPDCQYAAVMEFDVSQLEPQVALPHSPDRVRPVSALKGTRVDQVVIGSCTNGRLSDLRTVAAIVQGKRVARGTRGIVIPGSRNVYLQSLREGLIEILLEAGFIVSTPTCGPCFGGHMGILGPRERCVSTTNRNFVGRMGHPDSEVYLAGAAVAAAAAVAGEIVHPEEV